MAIEWISYQLNNSIKMTHFRRERPLTKESAPPYELLKGEGESR